MRSGLIAIDDPSIHLFRKHNRLQNLTNKKQRTKQLITRSKVGKRKDPPKSADSGS